MDISLKYAQKFITIISCACFAPIYPIITITLNNQTNNSITIMISKYWIDDKGQSHGLYDEPFKIPPVSEHYKNLDDTTYHYPKKRQVCYQLWTSKKKKKAFAEKVCADAAWNITKDGKNLVFTPKNIFKKIIE